MDRIRGALQREALVIPPIPDIAATFRVTVEETPFPVDGVLETMWRDLARSPRLPAPAYTRPSMGGIGGGVDVLGLVMDLANRIGDARRARNERAARREVEQALAEFCASHDCSKTEPGVSPSEGIIVPAKTR
jgi:hypothetical protein